MSRLCTLARAGHPPPALVRPDGTVEFPDLPAGPPLGLGGMLFESTELELPAGTLMVLYTDGLVESRAHDIDQGLDLLGAALDRPDRPLDDICETVLDSLVRQPPEDDVALLVARTRTLDASRVVSWELPRIRPSSRRRASVRPDNSPSGARRHRLHHRTGGQRTGHQRDPVRRRADQPAPDPRRQPHLRSVGRDKHIAAPAARPDVGRGGRGLFLVAQFTQRWGTRYTAGGKTIWAEQPIAAAWKRLRRRLVAGG